jgi:cellulose synthase/poly-beta-1,6-N-acetylglucosamine synthase-like glycosyltransferase
MVNLSIVIPTRNRPIALARSITCLDSQSQVSATFEVIVVDDHSDQQVYDTYRATVAAVRNFHCSLLRLPRSRRGTVFARSLGVDSASGDIIGFLDDDSFVADNWVRTVLSYFQNDGDVQAITGRIEAYERDSLLAIFRQIMYDKRQETVMTAESTKSMSQTFSIAVTDDQHLVDYLSGGNSAVRRGAIDSAGGFDSDFRLMHDRELAIRLMRSGKRCVYAPDVVVKHMHAKSLAYAMARAFQSGRMNRRLRLKHAPIFNEGVIDPRRPLANLRYAWHSGRIPESKILPVAACVILLEYLHQAGYLAEWLVVGGGSPRAE